MFAAKLMEPLNEATLDLFNGTVSDKTLIAAGQGPMSYDGTWRRSWLQLRRNVPGSWLHGLDFYVYVSSATGERHLPATTKIDSIRSMYPEPIGHNTNSFRSFTTESSTNL